MKSPLLCLMLAAFSASACAAIDLPPAALRDKGKVPTETVRTYELWPAPVPNQTKLTCHIRLTDSFFGYLSNDAYLNNEKIPFTIRCLDAIPPFEDISTVARFDPSQDKWVRNEAHRFYDTFNDPKEGMIWERRAANSIHFYELNNINAKGFAYTQDDFSLMDEDKFQRHLHYCLIKPPKALCGEGIMGSLKTIKKSDLTPYALKILRSIEFIDDTSPPKSESK